MSPQLIDLITSEIYFTKCKHRERERERERDQDQVNRTDPKLSIIPTTTQTHHFPPSPSPSAGPPPGWGPKHLPTGPTPPLTLSLLLSLRLAVLHLSSFHSSHRSLPSTLFSRRTVFASFSFLFCNTRESCPLNYIIVRAERERRGRKREEVLDSGVNLGKPVPSFSITRLENKMKGGAYFEERTGAELETGSPKIFSGGKER